MPDSRGFAAIMLSSSGGALDPPALRHLGGGVGSMSWGGSISGGKSNGGVGLTVAAGSGPGRGDKNTPPFVMSFPFRSNTSSTRYKVPQRRPSFESPDSERR